jgi:hypothetical protein
MDHFEKEIAKQMAQMTPDAVKKYASALRKKYPSRKDQIDKLSIEARRNEQ